MIRVSNVRKVYPTRFGNKMVLDNISFDLAMGEKLGVLGRNGAGKSTMIRLISGAEKPTSGNVERHMSVSWPLAFGGAFQAMLTGRDNVRFISGIYKQDFEKNLAFVEEFAELGPYLREPVRTYSSGMRARLAFAISMIIEFDCFLIDEIASVGDARFHDKCNFELYEKRNDRAMVIISHDAAYIRDHCTRWAVLHDGNLVHYSDFDVAYSDFKALIGVQDKVARVAVKRVSGLTIRNRLQLLESSHRTAADDDRFQALVNEANWERDKAEWTRTMDDWHAAERNYAAALALYPYERSYWVMHGHTLKEQGDLAGAEISYRTAIANGEPAQDVGVHLQFIINPQAVDDDELQTPAFRPGPLRDQLPGKPDILLLSTILWQTKHLDSIEILGMLRRRKTFDALLASMIEDDRFVRLDHGPVASLSTDDDDALAREVRIERTLCIFLPDTRGGERLKLIEDLQSADITLPYLLALGAFEDWPLTQASLNGRIEAPASASPAHQPDVISDHASAMQFND